MAAPIAALGAGRDIAEAVREQSGLVKRLGHAAARSAGLTAESNYSGARYLGALLALAYNNFATWWDLAFARSPVGQAVNVGGGLPRLRAKRDAKGNVVGTEVATTPSAWEARAIEAQISAGAANYGQAVALLTANPVLYLVESFW